MEIKQNNETAENYEWKKFIKNPPTIENLKSLYESELYQNILKEFTKFSKEKFYEGDKDIMLDHNKREYLLLNVSFDEVLSEFKNNEDSLLKYWLVRNNFFSENEVENLDGELPKGEELGEKNKSKIIETFGIAKSFLLDVFCEFYLLKTGDKERLLHYLKAIRTPYAKKHAGQITKLFKELC